MIKRKEYLDQLISYKDKRIIKVITGIRRCGKSTLLLLYKDYLLNNGIKEDHIILINFEDLAYEELTSYKKLYHYLIEKIVDNNRYYIILDEIQQVKHFEKAVDSLFLKDNVDLYITGSNGYMLSSELATLLSGRYVEISMLPLSFKEYLAFLGDTYNKDEAFQDYLKFGSFPYTVELDRNTKNINDYLGGIYSTVLIKDIVSRKKINDIMVLESLTKFVFDNIGNIVSSKKISDTLTSFGRKISPITVENYLNALIQAFFIYHVPRYDLKGKQYLKTLEKYYVVDIGLRNYLLGYRDVDLGFILENIVYLELLRRGFQVSIGKLGEKEVDFIAKNQDEILYIQVSQTVADPNTLKRELESLNSIQDHYEKMIITMDKDFVKSYNGIKKINIIDFLLS